MLVNCDRQVTFYGKPMRLIGLKLKIGDMARDVRVTGIDFSSVLPLDESKGKVRLFLTVPSLDTSICSLATKKFSEALREFDGQIVAYLLSADLPFAQNRWCETQKVDNIIMLSDYRNMDFARNWGLLIEELGLLARAVYIVDRNSKVTYSQIVPEISSEPNYEEVFTALKAITDSSRVSNDQQHS